MSATIRNDSRAIIDIDAPVIEFRRARMKKRRFKIVNPGDENIFPLGLSPQTSYDFHVEFTKLYERHSILRQYRKVIIRVTDRNGKIITTKRIRLPKI